MGELPELDNGWNINYSSVTEIAGSENLKTKKELEAFLCRTDIREFGQAVLVNISKTDIHLSISLVLQINSWRNVSAPKSSFSSARDDLTHGGLVRFFLTDGHSSISALSSENLSRSGLSMGAKVRIHKNCPMEAGFLMLCPEFMTVIGGSVERLRIKNEKERTEMYRLNGSAAARSRLMQPHSQNTEDEKLSLQVVNNAAANKPTEEDQAIFDETRQKNIAVASEGRTKTAFATPNIPTPPKLDIPREERHSKDKQGTNRGHDRQAKRRGRRGSDEEVPAEFSRPSAPSTLFDFIAPGATGIMTHNSQVSSAQRTEPLGREPPNARHFSAPQQQSFDSARSAPQRSTVKGQRDDRFGRNNRYEKKMDDSRNQAGRPERGHQENRGERKPNGNRNNGKSAFRPEERNVLHSRDRTRPNTESWNRNSSGNNSQRLTFFSKGRRNPGNGHNEQNQKAAQFFEDDFPSIDPLSKELHEMNLGPSTSKNVTTRTSIVHGAPRWRVNDKCLALWEDGEFYLATILALGPGDQCTVRYDEYGNTNTLEQAMLLTI